MTHRIFAIGLSFDGLEKAVLLTRRPGESALGPDVEWTDLDVRRPGEVPRAGDFPRAGDVARVLAAPRAGDVAERVFVACANSSLDPRSRTQFDVRTKFTVGARAAAFENALERSLY